MKRIPNFEDYAITEDGRIWSYKRNIWLKPAMSAGYWMYALTVNAQGTSNGIHRWLALTYIPNPDNLPVVGHRDGNKLNNALDNLYWCTQSQNMIDARDVTKTLNPQHSEQHIRSVLSNQDVLAIRRKYIKGVYGYVRLSKEYGVTVSSIQRILNGSGWKHV